jgi:hypothetical protein
VPRIKLCASAQDFFSAPTDGPSQQTLL